MFSTHPVHKNDISIPICMKTLKQTSILNTGTSSLDYKMRHCTIEAYKVTPCSDSPRIFHLENCSLPFKIQNINWFKNWRHRNIHYLAYLHFWLLLLVSDNLSMMKGPILTNSPASMKLQCKLNVREQMFPISPQNEAHVTVSYV